MRQVTDPYRLLGVPRAATLPEIKAAHRTLAKRYHPDAPKGDTRLFLAVQEAYQTLADPLRRRAWDASHPEAPAARRPPASAAPRRPAPSAGRAQPRPERPPARPGPAQTASPPPGAPGTTNAGTGYGYTWSAHEVPWWEDQGPSSARRPPGRKRPSDRPASKSQPPNTAGARPAAGATGSGGAGAARDAGAAGASGNAAGSGPRRDDARGGGAAFGSGTGAAAGARPEHGPGAADAPGPDARPPRSADEPAGAGYDFDVYSRSSGAAWSSAARAYFRRGTADVPRGSARTGSWVNSPPGTRKQRGDPRPDAARTDAGRASGETRAPRPGEQGRTAASGPSGAARPDRASGSAAAGSAPGGVGGRQRADVPPRPTTRPGAARASAPRAAAPGTFGRPPATSAAPGRPSPPPVSRAQRAAAASTATAAWPAGGTIPGSWRPGARNASEPWPTVGQRFFLATFGWIPIAIVIAAFLGVATGCENASVSCSRAIVPMQLGLLTATLLTLLLVPRLAYLAASGTLGLVAVAIALVAVYMVLGVAQPIPEPLVALALLVWIGGYLGAVVLAASDWPVPRPWRQPPAFARTTRVTR